MYGSYLADFLEMLQLLVVGEDMTFSSALNRELDRYDPNDLRVRLQDMIASLNPDQRRIFDTITVAMNSSDAANKLFFIDRLRGTGKSFMCNVLLVMYNLNAKLLS